MAVDWSGHGRIMFNREKLPVFKAAYAKAVAAGDKSFVFEGHDLLVTYASYVIELLEMEFKDGD